MRYALFLLCFIISISYSFGQDTIYLKRYPGGIISDEWQMTTRRIFFKPIDAEKRMYTGLDQLIKVVTKDSIITHEVQKKRRKKKKRARIILETNKRNAEVEYIRKVDIKDASFTDVRSVLRNLKLEGIEFRMYCLSKDDSCIIQCGTIPEDLYPNRKLFFNLSFKKQGNQLTYKFSDFLIRYPNENERFDWPEKVASAMDTAARTKSVSRLYRFNSFSLDQHFWSPISLVVEKLCIEIERVFTHEREERPAFNDYFIGLNGKERMVNILEDRGLVYKVEYQDQKDVKTDFLNKKKLYYLKKSNGEELFFSRKNEKKTGDFTIMDHNGLFVDLLLGYSHLHYKYDLKYIYDTTGKVIHYPHLLSFGTRMGRKWYFGSPSPKYSMGMQLSIGSEFSLKFSKKADLTHTFMLGIGYASIWKIKPDHGIEFNMNFGFGGLGWHFGTEDFIGIPWFDLGYTAITLYPEVKYRKKNMSYGVSYVELWQVNNNRFHKRSLLFSIGKAF